MCNTSQKKIKIKGHDLKYENQHLFNKKNIEKQFLLCRKIKHKKLLNIEKRLVYHSVVVLIYVERGAHKQFKSR